VSEARRARPIVGIDGPAGAGKSTVARRLAETLGFVLVDTGAMYRAVALAAKLAGVARSDEAAVGAIARSLVSRRALSFERDAEKGVRVRLDANDVTDAIRAPEIGMDASVVSAFAEVRSALLDLQRQSGRDGGVVLEGRDIGTVVFPDAEVKFFLTARADVRARRRFDELKSKGVQVTFEQTLQDVRQRDEQDMGRALAPLRQAPDALLLDNSDLSIDETVGRMVAVIRGRSAS
jgi:cytidylate kinase